MSLAKAPLHDFPWLLADWLEFKVLFSEHSVFRINDLLRISDEDQEEENPDIAEQDSINEQAVDAAIMEIRTRMDSLNSSYPFKLASEDTELILTSPPADFSPGSYIYLFCLFFSHINRDDVIIPDPPDTNADRDIMQICATLAAAGDVNGNAISFGFPRPGNTGFLSALNKTYRSMGEGEIVDAIPNGVSQHTKDAGVDVIAWSNTPDRAPGRTYLLGQVASGKDWETKSISGLIGPFHNTWFTRQPASTPIPAMFIPFCMDVKHTRELSEKIYYQTLIFGKLFYRYRLPHYAAMGYERASQEKNSLIERYSEFYKLSIYVDNFLNQMTT